MIFRPKFRITFCYIIDQSIFRDLFACLLIFFTSELIFSVFICLNTYHSFVISKCVIIRALVDHAGRLAQQEP